MHVLMKCLGEAKRFVSQKIWVPLSAQMPFFFNGLKPIENGITAPIGAILQSSLCRSKFFQLLNLSNYIKNLKIFNYEN